MAIIGKIRKHSGLAVIIVGVAIAAFVIGDFGKRRAKSVTNIGSVNGEQIPYLDFNNKVEENLELQKENAGNDKITEDQTYSIRQSTWNTFVKNIIMGDEYETLGLTVTPEELFDQVQGKNPHRFILQYFKDPKTGQYDPALVLNYLKNLDQMEPKARTQWLAFEKAIKEDRLETKFNNLVSKGYYLPKAFLKETQIEQTKTLKTRSIAPTFYNIPDSLVKLTDADYETFYNKNKGYFYADQNYRNLDIVVFDVLPSEIDRRKTAEDVEGIYKDFTTVPDVSTFTNANSDKKYDTGYVKKGVLPVKIDSTVFSSAVGTIIPPFQFGNAWYMAKLLSVQDRPDSMDGAQIMVTWEGTQLSEQVKRTKEQAKLRADSLVSVLKANPDKFAEMARQSSDFPSAKDDAGELKWFTDGSANYSVFFAAGLGMKPNEIKVVETRVGYSIFKMKTKTRPVKKVRVAVLQRNIEPSSQTFQDTYLKASAFAGENKTAARFDTAALKQGLPKRAANNIREMDNQVQGLTNAREMVRWAYGEETKIGDVSPVFDMTGKYAVAVLTDKIEKGIQPLDKIKKQIEPSVRNMKKIEILAGNLTNAMKTTQDINALASQFNAKVDTAMVTFAGQGRTAITREGKIVGELFTLKPNVLSGPLQGNFGAYVVIIDQVTDATPKEDFTYENNQAQQMFTGRVGSSLYDALKNAAKVEDSRIRFY
jgi:peptidyl-prolyl cis-trans isomerase D